MKIKMKMKIEVHQNLSWIFLFLKTNKNFFFTDFNIRHLILGHLVYHVRKQESFFIKDLTLSTVRNCLYKKCWPSFVLVCRWLSFPRWFLIAEILSQVAGVPLNCWDLLPGQLFLIKHFLLFWKKSLVRRDFGKSIPR